MLSREDRKTITKAGCLVLAIPVFLASCISSAIESANRQVQHPNTSMQSAEALGEPTPWSSGSLASATPKSIPKESTPAASTPAKLAPKANPISFSASEASSCSSVGCTEVMVKSSVKCKSIEIQVEIYDENDEWIDSYGEVFAGLSAGKTKRYLFQSDEYESWQVEVVDVVCL